MKKLSPNKENPCLGLPAGVHVVRQVAMFFYSKKKI